MCHRVPYLSTLHDLLITSKTWADDNRMHAGKPSHNFRQFIRNVTTKNKMRLTISIVSFQTLNYKRSKFRSLTCPRLRLLSSKAQGPKDIWNHLNPGLPEEILPLPPPSCQFWIPRPPPPPPPPPPPILNAQYIPELIPPELLSSPPTPTTLF